MSALTPTLTFFLSNSNGPRKLRFGVSFASDPFNNSTPLTLFSFR
jgi:hypothetical protein